METIELNVFKIDIWGFIKSVYSSMVSFFITDKGKHMVKINPAESFSDETKQKSWLGCMKGTGNIIGDIVNRNPFEPC